LYIPKHHSNLLEVLMMKKVIIGILLVVPLCCILGFLALQIIPFGKNHQNPPVVREPQWDSPRTRELAKRACFDCHSNETIWPWYSNIAPVSWLVARDVQEGRGKLNFSEGGMIEDGTDEVISVIEEGEMPLKIYLIQHPEARLSSAETQELMDGLQKTLSGGN
jgi:hypothetical protein